MTKQTLSRRDFLKASGITGAALVVGVPLSQGRTLFAQNAAPIDDVAGATEASYPEGTFVPSMWLAILPNGDVKIWAHRSEMGTGIRTSLPMVVADELDADWSRIELMQGKGDPDFGSQNTDGSRSIRRFYQAMRIAGASAAHMLEAAAAKQWGVDPSLCHVKNHSVTGPGGKSLGVGELAAAASAIEVPKESDLRFKKPKEQRYVGKENVRLHDCRAMITGEADFGADVDFGDEEMLTAVILRPATLNGDIDSVDTDTAMKIPGVVNTVKLAKWQGPGPAFQPLGGIAVIAKDTWSAIRGRRALIASQKSGGDESFDSKAFSKELVATSNKTGKVIRQLGDADAAMKDAAQTHSADYSVPFLSHTPMEPPAAIARWSEDKCEVWAPTQNPQAVYQTLEAVLGMSAKKIEVNVTFLGGGFGRKSKADFSAEAAVISKMLGGKLVRVQWTREDDIQHDYYHTSTGEHVEAGLGEDGMPVAWIQRSSFPSIFSTFNRMAQTGGDLELGLGFTDLLWDVKNLRCEVGNASAPTRIGWLRSVNHIPHAFAEGSFADELAAKAGVDPVEYLRKLIGEDRKIDFADQLKNEVNYPNHGEPFDRYPIDTARWKHVLDLVARRSGWGRKMSKGRGMGIAVHRSFLSYVGCVVEVEVTPKGKVILHRMDVAIDCGLAVNPDRVRAQMEGSAIFGATLALYGEISFKDGKVEQSNFHDYQMLRMHEAPKEMHTYIVESEALPSGVGEPGTPPVAPAICNAIFAATGKRIRELPIKNHDLSW